jgi:hypothetical protein
VKNISFDKVGYPRIYTIHSQKGGVGKTSVALAIAGISGAIGEKTLLIDADMTGASIADLPGMECEQGNSAKWFNELILEKPNKFAIITSITPASKVSESMLEAKFCRKTANHESVYFIPSNAKPEAVQTIVPLIAQEDHLHFFRHRIEDIIAAAIRTGFEMIILDHSPGLFGFSKTSLEMSLEWSLPQDKTNHRLRYLINGIIVKRKKVNPSLQALLVSSFEPHDYRAVLASFSHVLGRLNSTHKIKENQLPKFFKNSFRMIFNRAKKVSDSIEEVDKVLSNIGYLTPELKQMIEDHEREFGIRLAPEIDDFSMGDICSNAKAFVSRDKYGTADGKWEDWFRTLAYRARLIKE